MTQHHERKNNLADYFASHLVTIVYRHELLDRHGKPIPGRTTLANASGFLMVYRGVWFLLTAGHVIRDMDELLKSHEDGRLTVVLVDGLGYEAQFAQAYPFPYEILF